VPPSTRSSPRGARRPGPGPRRGADTGPRIARQRGGGARPGPGRVDIVTDDMPFLVDSVTMELNPHQADITLLLHRGWWCARDVTACCTTCPAVSTVPGGAWGDHRVLDPRRARQPGDGSAARLRGRVAPRPGRRAGRRRRPAKMIAAAAPWPSPWRGRARRTAAGATQPQTLTGSDTEPASCSAGSPTGTSSSSATASTTWCRGMTARRCGLSLAPGRFLAPRPAGLGLVRGAARRHPGPRPAIRTGWCCQGQLPVHRHRSKYLDYVSVRSWPGRPGWFGEWRFLGLYTHAPNREHRPHPVLRGKLADVLAGPGSLPKARRQRPHRDPGDYPREELFQISTRKLTEIATAVLPAARAQQTGCSCAGTPTGVHVLLSTCPGRYTTPCGCRSGDPAIRPERAP